MSQYQFSTGQFQVQDIIRTISISFQPYLPFTEVYQMDMQSFGGGSISSIGSERMGYYRIAPSPSPGKSNPDSVARELPWSEKRMIYTGQGSKYPRLSKMSKYGVARSKRVVGVAPQGQSSSTVLGKELSELLNANFDGTNFVDTLSGATMNGKMIRDYNELNVNMISQMLDAAMGSGKIKGRQGRDMSGVQADTGTSSFAPSSQGFDIDLQAKGMEALNEMVSQKFGTDLDPTVSSMEVTSQQVGSSKKALFSGVNYEGKKISEQKKLWVAKIKNVFTKWNAEIRKEYKQLSGTQGYSSADKAGAIREQFQWKKRGKKSYQATGMDYEIRQMLDRFIKSKMRPYLYEGPLTANSRAITQITPIVNAEGIPQVKVTDIARVTRVVKGRSSIADSLVVYYKGITGNSKSAIDTIAHKARADAAAKSISKLARLQTVGKYTTAKATLDSQNALQVQIGGNNAVLHKVSNDIAATLTSQLKEYYSSPAKNAQFQAWYSHLMRDSNRLTQSWYQAAKKLTGEKLGNPLSEEFRFGNQWAPIGSRSANPSSYGKKKYTGVWNGENQEAWKGANKRYGYNFSISPMMEARRYGTGDVSSLWEG